MHHYMAKLKNVIFMQIDGGGNGKKACRSWTAMLSKRNRFAAEKSIGEHGEQDEAREITFWLQFWKALIRFRRISLNFMKEE